MPPSSPEAVPGQGGRGAGGCKSWFAAAGSPRGRFAAAGSPSGRSGASGNRQDRFGGATLWLRFLLLAGAFGLLGQCFAAPLTRMLLPLFRAEMEFVDDSFRIESLTVDRDAADRVLRVEVSLAHAVSVNGRTFYPDPRGRAQASTMLGNIWAPCALLLAVAFTWPARSRRSLVTRALAAVPALLLLCVACAPLILLASLRGILLEAAHSHAPSLLMIWAASLLNGGLIALSLVMGASLGHLSNRQTAARRDP